MRTLRILSYGGLQFVLFAAGCYGQEMSSRLVGREFTATFRTPHMAMRDITDAPYSGELVFEHTQTLADGTPVTEQEHGQVTYRDSLGRTRTERAFTIPEDSDIRIVQITDPVERLQYTLDPVNKIAHRAKWTVQNPSIATTPSPAGGAVAIARFASLPPGELRTLAESAPLPLPTVPQPNRAEVPREWLGTQTIEGLAVNGTRMTSALSTTELWMSPELQVMVLSKHHDPKTGDSIVRLTNITRAEPDPTLFRVSSDYQIVDEEGGFTIQFTIPAK